MLFEEFLSDAGGQSGEAQGPSCAANFSVRPLSSSGRPFELRHPLAPMKLGSAFSRSCGPEVQCGIRCQARGAHSVCNVTLWVCWLGPGGHPSFRWQRAITSAQLGSHPRETGGVDAPPVHSVLMEGLATKSQVAGDTRRARSLLDMDLSLGWLMDSLRLRMTRGNFSRHSIDPNFP